MDWAPRPSRRPPIWSGDPGGPHPQTPQRDGRGLLEQVAGLIIAGPLAALGSLARASRVAPPQDGALAPTSEVPPGPFWGLSWLLGAWPPVPLGRLAPGRALGRPLASWTRWQGGASPSAGAGGSHHPPPATPAAAWARHQGGWLVLADATMWEIQGDSVGNGGAQVGLRTWWGRFCRQPTKGRNTRSPRSVGIGPPPSHLRSRGDGYDVCNADDSDRESYGSESQKRSSKTLGGRLGRRVARRLVEVAWIDRTLMVEPGGSANGDPGKRDSSSVALGDDGLAPVGQTS